LDTTKMPIQHTHHHRSSAQKEKDIQSRGMKQKLRCIVCEITTEVEV
jgi:hypothetical protein